MKLKTIVSPIVVLLSGLSVATIAVLAQSGTLTGAGSTFVNPLLSKWSKEYHTLHPNVEINYQSIGSGGGAAVSRKDGCLRR